MLADTGTVERHRAQFPREPEKGVGEEEIPSVGPGEEDGVQAHPVAPGDDRSVVGKNDRIRNARA
jgi:hypothetical protein